VVVAVAAFSGACLRRSLRLRVVAWLTRCIAEEWEMGIGKGSEGEEESDGQLQFWSLHG
jgi:hypothetical protein